MTLKRWLFNELRDWRSAALPGLIVIVTVMVVRMLGFLQPLEWMALDSLMRHRPSEAMDNRVVVVEIDDEDIAQLKTYPIPDQELANAIAKLQFYQPVAIGLDMFRDLPVEPGHGELLKAFQIYPNLFAIEQLPFGSSITIPPPNGVSNEQVGFANSMPLDEDGHTRRHLLGATDPRYLNTPQAVNFYKYSLATQLALKFLAARGIRDEAGYADPDTLRLGTVEFPRVQSNTGAYVGVDSGGTQVLINYRSGLTPFRVLSLRQIRQNQIQPEWIRGKVILIGVGALRVGGFANVASIPIKNSDTYPGVKVHAHAVSQILAAVLDMRPLLKAWIDIAEYSWIVLWGFLGAGLGRKLQAPWLILLIVLAATLGLVGICYVLLVAGWWIPLVPAAIVFLFNGAGLSLGMLYRTKQDLEVQERLRQAELEQIFNSIHNNPLQRLTFIIRHLKDQPDPPKELIHQLNQLDLDLRSLRDDIGRIVTKEADQIQLGSEWFTLALPLNELLEIVCDATLRRVEEFPGFKQVKMRLIEIPWNSEQMISDKGLSLAQKDWLCRFLEEAIINVGKHGVNVTKIEVFCGKEYRSYVIRVKDNGTNQPSSKQLERGNRIGGTRAARNLAKQLGGTFKRFPNQPQGTVCELKWRAR